jgi:hypothetical protein
MTTSPRRWYRASMKTRGLAWGLAGAIVLAHGVVALACKVVPYLGVTAGFLGAATYSGSGAGALHVPRNVVVADMDVDEPVELLDEASAVIDLEPVPGTVWLAPVALLEAGVRVTSHYAEAVVDDVIDETSPSAPELVGARVHVVRSGGGCRSRISTCEGIETLYVTIDPSDDDYSPPDRLTYAVYGGIDAGEAESAALPVRLLVPAGDGTELRETWGMLDTDDVEWLAIAAVDQAGNVSARSAPVRLRR